MGECEGGEEGGEEEDSRTHDRLGFVDRKGRCVGDVCDYFATLYLSWRALWRGTGWYWVADGAYERCEEVSLLII